MIKYDSNKSVSPLGRSGAPLLLGQKFSFFVLLAVLFFQPANAEEGWALKSIAFKGNHAFSKSDLLQQMSLRSRGGLRKLLFWQKPSRFSEMTLQRDLQQIVTFYQTEGFPQAKIDSTGIAADEKKRSVRLTIYVAEEKPALVRSLKHEIEASDEEYKRMAEGIFVNKIQPALTSRLGERFRDANATADVQTISTIYNNAGFPNVQVQPHLQVEKTTNAVDLTFRISTGIRFKFGEVQVTGNERISASTVLKQVTFKPGDIFSQAAVSKSQQQVYELGMFQFASIKMLLDKSQSQSLPVQILVKEVPPIATKLGVGWGREDQFRTFIDFRLLGFTGAARTLSIYAKHSGLEPYNVDVKWTRPAFLSPRSSITLNPFYRKESELGFTVTRAGGNVTYQRRFATYSDVYLNYALERDRLSVTSITRREALDSSELHLYNKSGVTLGLTRDSSLPIFSPNTGTYRSLTVTMSGLGFNSDFHYSRWLLEMRFYQTIGSGWVSAYRIKMGAMSSWKSGEFTPIEDRFFAGGSASVRGWARSQLGPKSAEDRPIGGNSLLETSAEIRYPLFSWLGGVAFVDAGNVWSSAYDYRLSGLHYAAGLGLRFKTPIAPIRFDVAVPVFEGANPVQLHVSVGQAF